MRIEPQEFEVFEPAPETATAPIEITFSVKECRAILSFCAAQGVALEQISFYFHGSGDPIMFGTDGACVALRVHV